MQPASSSRLTVAAALFLFAVAVWATGVLTIVWAADFDGSDESSAAAAASAAVLACGVVLALVTGVARRRWSVTSLVLLVAMLAAALPWLAVL